MKNKQAITASKLRIVLVLTILLLASLGIVGFYFAQSKLNEYAKNISQINADTDAGDENIASLQKIKKYIDQHQSTISKAGTIVAQSRSYAYQDQIIDDIVSIGNKSNIAITGFDFASDSGDTAAGTGAATTPAPVAAQTPAAAPVASGGSVKSTIANVTIDSTANYNDILSFIKGIEQNPTKMQIQQVSLAKAEGNKVTTQSFSIEVYIR